MRRFLMMGMVLAAGTVRAASVTFATPVTCSADTDVSTNGTLVSAMNFGGATATLNGVAFASSSSTFTGIGGVAFNGFGGGSSTPFANLSADYQTLLANGKYMGTAAIQTLTLNGLTAGRQYEVQLWCNDSRSYSQTTWGDTVTGGNSVLVYTHVTAGVGGVGQYTIGTFTADATTQTFTIQGNWGGDTYINDIQLRDVTLPTVSYYWDQNGNTPGIGGSGSWDTNSSFWTLDSSGVSGSTVYPDNNMTIVTFGGTPGTVTIAAATALNLNSIVFATNGYTLAGTDGTAMLNASGLTEFDIATGAGNVGTISAVIAGSVPLAKVNDSGTLVLAGTNTFSGALSIGGGSLVLGGASRLGNGNYSASILNNGALVCSSSAPQTFGGVISGTGSLTKTGGSTLTLNASNSYLGGTTVNGGVLTLNTSTAIRNALTISSGAEVVAPANWALGLNGPSYVTDIIINGGTLNVNNAAYGGMSATNITMTAGNVVGTMWNGFYDSRAGQTFTVTTLPGLVPSIWSAPLGLRIGDNSVSGNGTLNFNVAPGTPGGVDFLISGAIGVGGYNGTGQTLVKSGAGTLKMAGANTYVSPTIINGGTVLVTGSLPAGNTVTVNSGATLGGSGTVGGTLTANAGATVSPGIGIGKLTVGTLNLSAGCTNLFEFDVTPTNDLIAVTTSGGLTLNGGEVLLCTAGTTNVWTTTGTYTLMTYSGALGGVGSFHVANPAPGLSYFFSTAGNMVQVTITDVGPSTWTGGGGDDYWQTAGNWGGVAPVSGAQLVFDTSTRTANTNYFTAASAFAILFTNTAGAFTLSGNSIALTGDVVNLSASAQAINLDMTLGSVGRAITTVGPIALNGVLSGGGISKGGAGTLSLSGANNYAGVTTVNGGVLKVNNESGSGTGSGPVSINAGTTLGGTGTVSGAVTVAAGGTLAAGNGVGTLTAGSLTLAAGSTNSVEFDSTPANDRVVLTGGLTNNGCVIFLYTNGTTGAWSKPGIYTLFQFAGTIGGVGLSAFSVANPVPGLTYAFTTNGTSLQVNIGNPIVWTGVGADDNWTTSGNWGGSAPIPGSVLTFDTANRTVNSNDFPVGTPFSCVFTNTAAAFTLNGSAIGLTGDILNLSTNAQTINNDLALTGGSRSISNSAAAGVILNGVISGSYGLAIAGTGTVTLAGANTYSGATTISAGVLEVGGAGVLGGGTYNASIANAGLFRINSTSSQVLGGGISGTGALVKASSGTLTLTGGSSYSGGTTVNSGVLALGNQVSPGVAVIRGTLTINNGGKVTASTDNWSLGYGGGTAVTGITITGGTLTFFGAPANGGTSVAGMTMTGGVIEGVPFDWFNSQTSTPVLTTLASSTTAIISSGFHPRLGNNKVTLNVASGSAPGGIDLLVSGPILAGFAGDGIIKAGAGMAVLTGTNTYTGATTVTGGTLAVGGAGLLGANTYSGAISNTADIVFNSSANQTLSGIISGSGTLTQAGPGMLTLTGSNTYTGVMGVTGGTLVLGATNVLSQAGTVLLAGGTLDMGVYTNQAGTVVVGPGTSTIPLGIGSLQFADSTSNVWSGTLTLTGTLNPQSLRFGIDRHGLTQTQLGMMTFNGKRVELDANGYVALSAGFLLLVQ